MAEQLVTDFVKVGFNLEQAVSAALDNYKTERDRIHAAQEATFQEAVASNTLSPDAQITYRQTMLDNAKAEAVPDPDYVTTLETALANTTAQAHSADVLAAVNADKADAAGGLESNQAYLEQLKTMLGNENDPTLQKTLQDEITTTQGAILSAKLALIGSEEAKGAADDSISELNLALNDAQDQKAQALAVGDTARAASLDVTIGAAQQKIANIRIDTENNGLNINKSVDSNPLGYVGQLQNLISTSDSTTPIQYYGVGGSLRQQGYSSEQAYWQAVLANYLNTNFVKDLQTQYTNYVNNSAIVNKLIPSSVLNSVQTDFAQLQANPLLSQYVAQIQQVGTTVLGDAVNKNAAAIVDDYKVNNDANGALSKLDALSTKYGIDVTSYTNQVVSGAAKQTTSGISAIQSAASAYETQDGMDPDSALKQAISDYSSGKLGGAQSSKELATETPADALKNNGTTTNTPPVTTTIPSNENPTPAQTANEPSKSPLGNNPIDNSPAPQTAKTQATNPPATTPAPSGLQMPTTTTPKFTSVFKTANSPQVYGTDASGTNVAFENEDQLASAGFKNSDVKTVDQAPTNAVVFSQYNPSANQPNK